jgi:hypothetical protein
VTGSIPTGANVIGGVTQSGTWTFQPGNTANTTPWLVTATLSGSSNAVNATLGAETTKVIGTVNQGTSPWVVSNGGTFAVQAAQATAANLNATVVGTGTFATQATLSAETTKVIGTVNQGTNPWAVNFATSATGAYSFNNIKTSTTTLVKSGAGTLHTLCVNTDGTVASAVTMFDNTAGSGTTIASINSLSSTNCYLYDIAFTTGLTVVTTGTAPSDITVSFK